MKNNMQEKKTKPTFSIIVPIYNVEIYLKQCIESIINQTYSDIEIILVDDGSTDQSGKICDQYAEEDPRIKVIHQKNGGPQSARKAGLEYTTSGYVIFVDGDDFILESMCADIHNMLLKYSADIVVMGSTHVYPEHNEIYQEKIESGYYSKQALKNNVYKRMMAHGSKMHRDLSPALWGKCFKRDIIVQVLPNIDEHIRVGQDVPCTYHSMLLADSVLVCNEMHHYHYRCLSTSGSRIYKKNWGETVNCLCEQLDRIYKSSDYQYLKENFLLERFWAFYCKANREFEMSEKTLIQKIQTMKHIVDYPILKQTLHETNIDRLSISIGKKIEFKFLRDGHIWCSYIIWRFCYFIGYIKHRLN